jgi:mannan endo-1,4-beta-mannosidase
MKLFDMGLIRVIGCAIVAATSTLIWCRPVRAESGFANFITAEHGRLMDGDKEFRFISFNVPNLTYTEDDMRFEQLSNFRLPTPFEIDDALTTIRQLGGRVARTYVLSVRKPNDPPGFPRHILGPAKLNEEAMVILDRVLEIANRRGVRLIVPFVDQAGWWGGIEELAGFRGKTKAEFYTDPQIKEDYKRIVALVVNRINTRTGVRYKDDKTVMAWELGNELKAPKEWVGEMAPYLKQIDPNHLVAESYFTDPENPGVDIVQDHLYQGDPVKMIDQIHASARRAAGRKVYMVGEFGFISTEGMRAIMDTIIQEPAIAGGLIWSLRFHNQDGGYYWHQEPSGGDFFKAYHWPGGPAGDSYDETRFMRLTREKAWEIQNQATPPLDAPFAPELTSITDGGIVTWRGTAGAAGYDLQRSTTADSPWTAVAFQLTDDAVQYRALANDEFAQPGQTYYYRLIARNEAGLSGPSKVYGPVKIRCHTLVDELRNLSLVYRKGGRLEIRSNDARNFKEDCHRLWGAPGAWVAYRVAGQMTALRVYAFGEKGEPALEFRLGSDNAEGELLDAKAQDFYAGKEMYNYHWPRLYTLAVPSDSSCVTIRYQTEAQIARVEIEYQ